MFFINNMNLQYPHAMVERVSVGWNFVYAGGVPLVTLIIALGILRADGHKVHVTLLGFFIAYVMPFQASDTKTDLLGLHSPHL